MTSLPESLSTPVVAFLQMMRVERQLSPRTVETYRRQLAASVALLLEGGLCDWTALDTVRVRSLVARSRRQDWSRRVWRCACRHCAVFWIGRSAAAR